MGNYERTYKRIDELEQNKKFILSEIESMRNRIATSNDIAEQTLLADLIESYRDDLYEVTIELGENYGYLRELESIDGADY